MVKGNFRMQNERMSGGAQCPSDNVKQILSSLQKIDFSLADTVLYLDAYPHCKKALEHYRKLLAQKELLSKKLLEMGYPINCVSNVSDSWKWTDGPWPWEYEANI